MSVPAWTLLQGLITGLGYGLLAVGLVLIYRTSRVLNLAHAQVGLISAVLLAKLVEDFHIPYGPAVVFALAVGAAAGAGCELVLRRLFRRPRLLVMVATIGLAEVLFLVTELPFVRTKHPYVKYPLPFHATLSVGHPVHYFTGGDVLVLLVAPVVALAVALFFRLSSQGLAMRAMADNSDAARLSGVWVRRTSTLAWTLAAALSGVTAILASPGRGSGFAQELGPVLLLRALTAALVAGMTSLPVAFASGIGLGVVEQLLAQNVRSGATSETILFALLLMILLARGRALRPAGREAESSSWQFATQAGIRRDPADLLRRDVSRVGVAVTAAVLLVLPAILPESRAFLFSRIFLYAAIALSLTVLTGWAGQLSLGQFALVAVGATAAARLTGHIPVLLLLPAGGAIAAVVAVIIGLPALRIRGLYLAVSTLAFAVFMQEAVLTTSCWHLGGLHACTGLPDPASTLLTPPTIFGVSLGGERTFYYVSLGLLAVLLLMARWWRDRGVARDLIAVRDNETAAGAMGIRVVRTKLLGFALSGFIAGTAGVGLALATKRFSAGSFSTPLSLLIVAMVVIGGLGSLPGAVLGAAYLVGLPALFGSTPTVQLLTSGLGLTAFLLYLPGGLASVLARAGDGVAQLLEGTPPPDDDTSDAGEPALAEAAAP
jgi:ABC-type branched-subunit amino acid transport system permease subunit